MRQYIIRACLALLVTISAAAAAEKELRNPCESPSLPVGTVHIVIAGFDASTCFTHWLWDLGLTNALVLVYRRLSPDVPLKRWQGPCGMAVEERLLLPNTGRDLAAFMAYAAEFYEHPPSAVVFLHGHGPHGWHNDCESMVGRTRLFYRGLVAAATPDGDADEDAEFASHMVALTRFGKPGEDPGLLELVMDPTLAREGRGHLARRLLLGPTEEHEIARCRAFLAKWAINTTTAGLLFSNGATFILPWERILRHPKGFYREALQYSFSGEDFYTTRYCFEFVIFAWYQEPALSSTVQKLYWKASHLAAQYNLSSCSTPGAGCV